MTGTTTAWMAWLPVLWGCTAAPVPIPVVPRIVHFDTRAVTALDVNPVVSATAIAAYQGAQRDSLENALCLYGAVERRDTLLVLRIEQAEKPTVITGRTPTSIQYSCRVDAAYIGRWHTHLRPVGPSPVDEQDFWADTDGVVMLVGVALRLHEAGDPLLLVVWELVDRGRGVMALRGPVSPLP